MKVFIITDLEGVAGVLLHPLQTSPEGREYEKARLLLTKEVNAAVEGALAGGATEVVANDGHGGGFNFIIEELHPEGEYIMGRPRKQLLQGLDETFDCMFIIGAHAMAGTQGAVLDHTQSSASWVEMLANGSAIGEIGQWAAMAGDLGVPTVFVSGDDKACAEACGLIPNTLTVITKYGITRNCARLRHPAKVREEIKAKAKTALAKVKEIEPYIIPGPVELQVNYVLTTYAEVKEIPGRKRTGPRTVTYTGKTFREAWGHL